MVPSTRKSKKPHRPEQKHMKHSLIASPLKVLGDLTADASIQIDGMVEGTVHGTIITIRHGAQIKGSIIADTVQVDGIVEGVIEAQSIIISAMAEIMGALTCETLEVEAGAQIHARCRTVLLSDSLSSGVDAVDSSPVVPQNLVGGRNPGISDRWRLPSATCKRSPISSSPSSAKSS